MSAIVGIYNLRPNTFAYNEFPGVGAFKVRSARQKTINSDDYLSRFASLIPFGVLATLDGTVLGSGGYIITDNKTLVNGDQVVVAQLLNTGKTLTLPAHAAVAAGYKIWVFLQSKGTANLTVQGQGGDTVLGGATATLSTAGTGLRLQLSGTNWAAQ